MILLCSAAAALPLVSCSRVTGLPSVPASVSPLDAGLDSLPRLEEEARRIGGETVHESLPNAAVPPVKGAPALQHGAVPHDRVSPGRGRDLVARIRLGLDQVDREESPVDGLKTLREALEENPSDLLVGNAYRMAAYRLQRNALAAGKERGERMPKLPDYLEGEPLATLERIAAATPSREIRLQIAMAHVDRMVLNPALEIKAPASIDSVAALSEILKVTPYYVPALVARGLNFLHRPRRLVWPEHPAPPPDAASRDLALAAAVGLKVGGAAPRVKATILTLLGDACAHEGRVPLARSWWMLAREISDDRGLAEAIAERMSWQEAEMLDRLEDHLEERMADMEAPASDLSFLWGPAKGPL